MTAATVHRPPDLAAADDDVPWRPEAPPSWPLVLGPLDSAQARRAHRAADRGNEA